MYRIVYHETALTDMKEIVSYISHELNNPAAAENLINEMMEAGDSLAISPYKYQVYIPLRKLEHEYRSVRVGTYNMFYWISEADQTVNFTRVIYQTGKKTPSIATLGWG